MKTDVLKKFSMQCEKINGYPEFFSPIGVEMQYEANQQQGSSTFSGIDEKTLVTVLVHFRNLYMKSSEMHFPKIVQVVLNNPDLVEFHKLSREFLDAWNRLLDPNGDNLGGLRLSVNNSSLGAKRNLDTWMNEAFLHADQYNQGSNKGLDVVNSQPLFSDLSRLQFIDLLQRLAALVLSFDRQVIQKLPTT